VKIFTVQRKFIAITIIGFLVAISSVLPIKLAIARYQTPSPQAILTLGGDPRREIFTAEFAKSHPYLPIWVSTGSKTIEAREIFQNAGVNNRRVYIDRRATDTVTNFTTLVNDFEQQNIQHIYLITDDFHLPRAKAIAFIVLGSQGITYTPIFLKTNIPAEPKFKIARDVIRSFFWILTKHTGSSLNRRSVVE
jgi:uncharacterized SAM-binding protein YcdF (DUF218 family)